MLLAVLQALTLISTLALTPAAARAQSANACDLAIAAAYAENDQFRASIASTTRPRMRIHERRLLDTQPWSPVIDLILRAARPAIQVNDDLRAGFEHSEAETRLLSLPSEIAGTLSAAQAATGERRRALLRDHRELVALQASLRRDLPRLSARARIARRGLGLPASFTSWQYSMRLRDSDAALRRAEREITDLLPSLATSGADRVSVDLRARTVTLCHRDYLRPGSGEAGVGGHELCSAISLDPGMPRIIHDLHWLRSSGYERFSLVEERLSPACERRLAALRVGPSPVVGDSGVHSDSDGNLVVTPSTGSGQEAASAAPAAAAL